MAALAALRSTGRRGGLSLRWAAGQPLPGGEAPGGAAGSGPRGGGLRGFASGPEQEGWPAWGASAPWGTPPPFADGMLPLAGGGGGGWDLGGFAASSAAEAAEASMTPVSAVVGLLEASQAVSGVPWWAAIVAGTLVFRVSLLPLLSNQLQASAALQAARTPDKPGGAAPSWGETWRRVGVVREATGAPHPAWMVAVPAFQIPLFITNMMAMREMCLRPIPGLDTGGLLWFPDLTAPAMVLEDLTAPLGMPGILLPLVVSGTFWGSIQASFGGGAQTGLAKGIKLGMEWLPVLLFPVAMQMPHGMLVYWATSNTFSLGQALALKVPAVRGALGANLPPPRAPPQPAAGGGTPRGVAGGPAPPQGGAPGAGGGGGGGRVQLQPHDGLPSFDPAMKDANGLLVRAAGLAAQGRTEESEQCLAHLCGLHPTHARAHFALGQQRSVLGRWPGAAEAYSQAEEHELDHGHLMVVVKAKGVAWLRGGMAGAALEEFVRVCEATPGDGEAWALRSRALEMLGRGAEADEALDKAEALGSESLKRMIQASKQRERNKTAGEPKPVDY